MNRCSSIHIKDAPGLDPIFVYLDNFSPGRGRITIACFNQAWTAAWNAIGDRTVEQYIAANDLSYLKSNFIWGLNVRKAEEKYVEKIIAAVHSSILKAQGVE